MNKDEKIISIINSVFNKNLKSIIKLFPNSKNENYLLLVEKVDFSTLEQLSEYYKTLEKSPVILTEKFIETSKDSYPLEFVMFSSDYKLIQGIDFLQNIEIDKKMLRLQLEREMKGKIINFQSEILRLNHSKKMMNEFLEIALNDFFKIITGFNYFIDHNIINIFDSLNSIEKKFNITIPSIKTGADIISKKTKNQLYELRENIYNELIILSELIDNFNDKN